MRRLVVTLLALALPLSCGGRSQDSEPGSGGKGASGGKGESGGSGGSSASGGSNATGGSSASGGTNATGGSGASGGTNATGGRGAGGGTGGSSTGGSGGKPAGGSGGNATGGTGCRLAFPTCPAGEVEYDGPCAADLGCHEVTVCCSTIQCIPERASTGGSGGTGTGGTGGSAGASGGGGSGGAVPGDAGVECDPEVEHDRNYLGDPNTCLLIDYACTPPTTSFYNACGCGCEQDAICPEAFDCRPGARVAPQLACTPENLERCPFSEALE